MCVLREKPGGCGELRDEDRNTEWGDEPIRANQDMRQARGPKEDDKNQEMVEREAQLGDPPSERSIVERTVHQRWHEREKDNAKGLQPQGAEPRASDGRSAVGRATVGRHYDSRETGECDGDLR